VIDACHTHCSSEGRCVSDVLAVTQPRALGHSTLAPVLLQGTIVRSQLR
jgi:hypothetical protein